MSRPNKHVVEFWVGVSQPVLEAYVKKGIVSIDSETGDVEKFCKKCEEFWPLTNEFWYGDKNLKLGVHSWCKACYRNIRQEREAIRAKGQ